MLLRTFAVLALLFTLPVPATAATPHCSGYVALTYDDGPHKQFTRPLLSALQSVGARATFFNIGYNEEANPDLLRATVAAGMWLGNHSWSHPHLTKVDPAELTKQLAETQRVTREIVGQTPTLFRPPYGDTNAAVEAEARRQGMAQVMWTVDTWDWAGVSTEKIVKAASTAKAGGIILMHDGHRNTLAAVVPIVRDLRARGLCPGKIVNRDGTAVVTAP
ncbi:polysaccharide deacetylase family protein [Streptoalloteichus hindustanus]|uniref:Polysaccharide deacetylase n=1 Tax=Streptoalloteichus hindustanus TaxID=2017 RepID=A0A1M5MGA0_STRHI|nr:polysaccharide deacetylase family protein [Streptoalloteichus hindustanus]SHG76276.1 Polysaccharide deacetylase [Streptoalloteichus hindustanus]